MDYSQENKITVYDATRKIIAKLENNSDTSFRKATLANLRNSVGRDLNQTVEIWPLIFENVPDEFLSKNGILTYEERAIIACLQFFAIHQQGKGTKVAIDYEETADKYKDLGSSLKSLRDYDNSNAIDRRFNVMITSATFEELIHHLRHLIKLLKARSSGSAWINYPRLAQDLYWFQVGASDRVRLRWAQSYYSQNKPEKEENNHEK